MGINIPTKEELIANKPEFKDIAGYIGKHHPSRSCVPVSVSHAHCCRVGADSVKYLTIEGLVSAVQEGIASTEDKVINVSQKRVGHCTACLTGKYPVELEW